MPSLAEACVSGDAITCGEGDQVAWHDLGGRDLARLPVPDDGGFGSGHPAERSERVLSLGVLREAERRVEHDNRRDHGSVYPLPEYGTADGRRRDQEQHERVPQLRCEDLAPSESLVLGQPVRTVEREASGRLELGDAGCRIRSELAQHLSSREGPRRVERCCHPPCRASSSRRRRSAEPITCRARPTASGFTEIDVIPNRTRCSANSGRFEGA